MFGLFWLWSGAITRLLSSRKTLLLENLALRQQLAVLKRKNKRPRLNALNRFVWIAIQPFCVFYSLFVLVHCRALMRPVVATATGVSGWATQLLVADLYNEHVQ